MTEGKTLLTRKRKIKHYFKEVILKNIKKKQKKIFETFLKVVKSNQILLKKTFFLLIYQKHWTFLVKNPKKIVIFFLVLS